MARVTHHEDGYSSVEFASKKIVYKQDGFGDILFDRKKLHGFLEAAQILDKKPGVETTMQAGDLTVTSKYRAKERIARLVRKSSYYKVDLEGKSLFVKKTPTKELVDVGGGYEEVMDARAAKALISDLEWADILDYQFGYEDAYVSYSVTPWQGFFDSELSVYMANLEKDVDKAQELADLKSKVKTLKERLKPAFWEVREDNMVYDPETKKIYIFDLIKKPEREVSNQTMFVD